MSKLFTLALALLSSTHLAMAQPNAIKPYEKGDWSSLVKAANGAPLIVHFWGVTCAPCVKEMPKWGKFVAQNKNAKVIFIQVDDVSSEMVMQRLEKANLGGAINYSVTPAFDERLRFEIDPKWRGETPTTFLIDRNGSSTRHTGTSNFQALKPWLLKAQ